MNNHVVIMAGGIGSRFWPMSTPECPKQFIDILGCGKTLLQLTAERFGNLCPQENIWVVTSERYKDIVGTIVGYTGKQHTGRALSQKYGSLHSVCLLENKKEISGCQHCGHSF